MRKFKCYISVSGHGPETSSSIITSKRAIRSRAYSELRYTTADADYLYEHFKTPNYDTVENEKHWRLINPTLNDFDNCLSECKEYLLSFVDCDGWDGGELTIFFAGHGSRVNGALAFSGGLLSAEYLLNSIKEWQFPHGKRTRVDLVLDSCFSGSFITDFVSKAFSSMYDAYIFPCSLFASTLPDEEAFEYCHLGHGVFTAAFKNMIERPKLNEFSFLDVVKDRIFNRNHKTLSAGGVSYITRGKQHSFFYENGYFGVDGRGGFRIEDLTEATKTDLDKSLYAIQREK